MTGHLEGKTFVHSLSMPQCAFTHSLAGDVGNVLGRCYEGLADSAQAAAHGAAGAAAAAKDKAADLQEYLHDHTVSLVKALGTRAMCNHQACLHYLIESVGSARSVQTSATSWRTTAWCSTFGRANGPRVTSQIRTIAAGGSPPHRALTANQPRPLPAEPNKLRAC